MSTAAGAVRGGDEYGWPCPKLKDQSKSYSPRIVRTSPFLRTRVYVTLPVTSSPRLSIVMEHVNEPADMGASLGHLTETSGFEAENASVK